ncbi:unnamed protein product [Clonostachys byssicola]|uniref:Amine oxidase n=1 Tax=Clonostachys byssicola TaxID=160290 RepID=A0A9N9U6U2_9HYPO|nr:unnamed protein product [Clonostachys byssicola]
MVPQSKEGYFWNFEKNTAMKGLPTDAVKSDSNDVKSSYDVIVIGAGFTGLTAARDISLHGLSILILEARDRVGGRTWLAQGKHDNYEMGGGWVHHLQPNTWTEMARYGLTTPKTSFKLGRDTSMNVGGVKQTMRGADDSFLHLAATFFNVDGYNGRLVLPQPHLPLYNRKGIREWDISVRERIDQLNLSATEKDLLAFWMGTVGLQEAHKLGFLSLLRLYALSGYDFQRLLELSGVFKIPGGTTALANAMFSEFNGSALFNRKVKSIVSGSSRAQVYVEDGEIFSADRVICTVPINCLADIEFSPPLPPSYTSIKHVNLGGKLHAHSADGSTRFFGVDGPSKVACFGVAESRSSTGGTNMVFFKSSREENVDRSQLEILEEALRDLTAGGTQIGDIDEYLWHDWRHDEFSKGAWAVYGPGALSGPLGDLMEDYADGWVGYIDGAVEQGRQAARAVINNW